MYETWDEKHQTPMGHKQIKFVMASDLLQSKLDLFSWWNEDLNTAI
jgi:hypothetical protein